jgi:hypothetical protein
VILPGYPLSHPDHEWLVRTLAAARLSGRVGLYAEQPYSHRTDGGPRALEWLVGAFGGPLAFEHVSVGLRDRLAKWRAVRQYSTQLPLLAMKRSLWRGPHTLAVRPESVAWADDRAGI